MTDEGASTNSLLLFLTLSLKVPIEKNQVNKVFSNRARSGANPPKGFHSPKTFTATWPLQLLQYSAVLTVKV